MKYFSFSPVLTSLALVICSTTALAKEPKAYTMDRVVVSATRTAQSVDETLAPVSVITREDIERSQASSVPELLRTVPGVQLTSNGGRGASVSMMIRGASSEQTLVLIDGQRINGATNGTPELQYLDPSQIDRIEIVRGPASSLYGADAIGGVVNIFTRKGEGKPHISVRTAIGTDNTKELGFNAGGKSGNTRFNIGVSTSETDGYNFTNDDYSSASHPASKDDDGYRNTAFSSNVSHQFSNGVEVGISLSHVEGRQEYDGTYDAYNKFENSTINVFAQKDINDIWFSRIDAGYVRNNSNHLGDDTPSEIETKRTSLLWQNDISWQNNQLLTTGVDYYHDTVGGSGEFIDPHTGKHVDSRYNSALFVQNQSQFENSDLQIALRQDENEAYGSNTTGNIAYGYYLFSDIRLVSSYAIAFRAPTFNNLYYPKNDYGYHGNPDLKPEHSQNYELALKGNQSIGRWEIAIFQNSIEDMIATGDDPKNPKQTMPVNVDKARIRGLEASINSVVMEWNINSTLTLLDPRNRKTDTYLARRAKQNITLSADRQFGSWSTGATVYAQGRSYNKDSKGINSEPLSGFATIDFRLAKQLNKEFKSQLILSNLLDKEYSTTKGYNAPPRAGIVSLTWTPEF
ncbi:TonB-dependent receptor [uncultured Endozoicomonas sp.]|uniref:TonB-dependent receptor domain-containing protein n=1 Tax=uncultured Endozoicomonas sp. TaxID=432652 RepID=UPI002611523F|nr:TonB-dependent receptor [uncultured Endozoicomonas sp.]